MRRQRLADANPSDGRNYNNIGLQLLLLRAYDEAAGAFEAAVRAEGESPASVAPANNLLFARKVGSFVCLLACSLAFFLACFDFD